MKRVILPVSRPNFGILCYSSLCWPLDLLWFSWFWLTNLFCPLLPFLIAPASFMKTPFDVFLRPSSCIWIYRYFNYRLAPHGPQCWPWRAFWSRPVLSRLQYAIRRFKLSLYRPLYQQKLRSQMWGWKPAWFEKPRSKQPTLQFGWRPSNRRVSSLMPKPKDPAQVPAPSFLASSLANSGQ